MTKHLTVQDYQSTISATDRLEGKSLALPLLGLFGETGSLLSEAKKKHRDAASYVGYEATVVEELGDVLWYLSAVATRAGIHLADLAHNLGFSDWREGSSCPIPFAALQPQALLARTQPSAAFEDTY